MNGRRFRRGVWALGALVVVAALALAGCDNKDINSLPEAKGLPGTPALTASASGTTITLDWPSIPGATDYTLYWSNTAGVTTGTGAPIAAVTPPYAHTGLLQGTPYYYVVTATVSGLETPASNEASAVTIPPPPSGLTATPASRLNTLTWPATPGATRYDLYWLPTSDVTPASGNPLPNVSSGVVHSGLFNDSPHFYVLTASNAAGTSAPSGAVLGLTPLPNVAVFFDGAFVGTGASTSEEGFTMLNSIQGFIGYPAFPFSGPSAASFAAATTGMDALVIPELELNDLALAMGPDVFAIESFVAGGGTLVTASAAPNMMNLINLTFGFGVLNTSYVIDPFPLHAASVGTIFEAGPDPLPWNNGTDVYINLPPGAIPIYTSPGGSAVTLIPYGSGRVVMLGWDWFDAIPVGFQDGGWMQVLSRALRL